MNGATVILACVALLAVFHGAARVKGASFNRAGYSMAQDVPIFLVIFTFPAVAAILLARRA